MIDVAERRYAAQTTVSTASSRAEIEKILVKYGASAFAVGWDQASASIMFDLGTRRIRFTLPLPDREDREFSRTPTGRLRSTTERDKAWEQTIRQRWRALALIVKAKLEAVAAGVATVDEEFLAYIVVPGSGRTVADHVVPELDRSYASTGYVPMLGPGRRQ